MRKVLSVATACLIVLPAITEAQPLRLDRERVLSTVGDVLPENIALQPTLPGPGLVSRQTVSKDATGSLRLHFTIIEQPSEPSWHLEVASASGARQQLRPDPDERDFWTAEIPGSSATVEMFTTAATVPVKLIIDRVAVGRTPITPQSIFGADQRELYRVQPDPIRTLGRSVVRLQFVDDVKKKVFVCTGFLVFTSAHLLTNEHCINSDAEMKSALVDFDFDGGGIATRTVKLSKFLMSDAALDFSLLQLAEPADRAVLTLKPGVDTDGRPLLVIEHPGGEVKQVSFRDCAVKGPKRPGASSAMTDFGHTCDTLGGSSGSPVFDTTGFTVVGLHHFGFFDGDPNPVNQAVHIALVIEAIKKRFPTLIRP